MRTAPPPANIITKESTASGSTGDFNVAVDRSAGVRIRIRVSLLLLFVSKGESVGYQNTMKRGEPARRKREGVLNPSAKKIKGMNRNKSGMNP